MNGMEKGICRSSLVAMFKLPSYDSGLKTQLLFGEHYSVLEKKDDWVHVKLHSDDSEGWIVGHHHCLITQEYFDQINLSDYKICTDVTGNIFFQKKHVNILIGSILPISTNELFKLEEQVAFNGGAKSLSQRREEEFLKEVVSVFMHSPYLPGGKSPFGIDHGALVQLVFKVCGYRVKRTLKEQLDQGSQVASKENIEPGDVVYVGNQEPEAAYIVMPDLKYVGIFQGSVQKLSELENLGNILAIRRILRPL